MSWKIAVMAALSVMIGASRAQADPLVIVPDGGTVQLTLDFEGDWFRFVGQNFSITTDGVQNVGLFFPRVSDPTSCGEFCGAGDVLNTSFHTPGEILFGAGSATFGSTAYSDLTLRGTLDFDVAPFVFPNVSTDSFFYSSPFTFQGVVRGITSGGSEAFAVDLAGTGNVRRLFDRAGSVYVGGENQTVYEFEASQTPEPGTVLLMMTGLAPLAARYRRRKLTHPPE